MKEDIKVLKSRRCPDCGGEVAIRKAEKDKPYPLYWKCTECLGEAGISQEAYEEVYGSLSLSEYLM